MGVNMTGEGVSITVLRHIWGRTKSYKNIAQIFDIQINMFIISW